MTIQELYLHIGQLAFDFRGFVDLNIPRGSTLVLQFTDARLELLESYPCSQTLYQNIETWFLDTRQLATNLSPVTTPGQRLKQALHSLLAEIDTLLSLYDNQRF
jgi:hypothetical protein